LSVSYLPRAFRAWRAYGLGQGEFTSNVAEAGGFAKSDPARERPNLQFHFIPAYLRDHGRQVSFGYGYTLHVCDLLPESRGRIRLASPDPTASARIEPNYLSDERDVETMLKAVKMGRAIMDAPALAAHRKAELHPGPQVRTEDELVADIRARAETIYHPAGTCRMGTGRGLGGRPAIARAGRRGPAGRRCLGDAAADRRQHQCTDDDDRRERGGDDDGRGVEGARHRRLSRFSIRRRSFEARFASTSG
jgi:choline dehydrogenase